MTHLETEQMMPLCELALQAGREELCPKGDCPLWEDDACSLERLLADELREDGPSRLWEKEER